MSLTDEVLVFHVREQASLADAIIGLLEQSGIQARSFSNPSSKRSRISPETQVLVFLWSEEAAESSAFKADWTTAFRSWARIRTIRCDDTDLPIQARSSVYVLDTSHDAGKTSSELVNAIRKLMRTLPSVPILIRSGEFYVGSHHDKDNAFPNEFPERKSFVIVYDYSILRFPVLVSEYRVFVEAAWGYEHQEYWTNTGWKWRKKFKIDAPDGWEHQNSEAYDRFPVTGVSFYEAVAYCNWFTEYRADGNFYRLPSETEWEKAARGGLQLSDGRRNEASSRIWPWIGPWERELANTVESQRGQPISVDEHEPRSFSPYGVVAMAGNLWEWCGNRETSSYPSNEIDTIEGSDKRMARGGAYIYDARYARCSRRLECIPTDRDLMSFRVACASR